MNAEKTTRLWTVAEAAAYLGISTVHFRTMRRNGRIPSDVAFVLPTSDRIRIRPDRLKAWIEGNPDNSEAS